MATWEKEYQAWSLCQESTLTGIKAVSCAADTLIAKHTALTNVDMFGVQKRVWTETCDFLCEKFNECFSAGLHATIHEHAHTDIKNTDYALGFVCGTCFVKITILPNHIIGSIPADIATCLVPHAVSKCGHVQIMQLCTSDAFIYRANPPPEKTIVCLVQFLINVLNVLRANGFIYTDVKLENVGIIHGNFFLFDLDSIMLECAPMQKCTATFMPDPYWLEIPRLQKLLPLYGLACSVIDLANATMPMDKVDPIAHKLEMMQKLQMAVATSQDVTQRLFQVALFLVTYINKTLHKSSACKSSACVQSGIYAKAMHILHVAV